MLINRKQIFSSLYL